MLSALRARGPDAQRTLCSREFALGHGLLATTPEDLAVPQPFRTRDGAVLAALDGRVDNRGEIADALGAHLRNAADVEVLAAAYQAWGDAFLDRVIGEIAAVVWDEERGELVLARDPSGARPLYFSEHRASMRAASHPLSVLAGTARSPAPRFEAMALFLADRYVEQPETLLEGVTAVAPGETRRFGRTTSRRRTASWTWLGGDRLPASKQDRDALFRHVLREAVSARMRASGPIAAHVSGGLDSSSIAAIATSVARARGTEPPLLVRSVFPGLPCDESPFSQAVADHLRSPLISVQMPGDLNDYAPDPERTSALYFVNPISRMLIRMSEAALERRARVTLTGAGSDQLLLPTGFELSDALRRGDVRAALRWARIADAPLSLGPYKRLVRQGFGRALPDRWRRRLRSLLGRREVLPAWLSPRAARIAEQSGPAIAADLSAIHPLLSVQRLLTQLVWDPDYAYGTALAGDIASAHGAELRHPFYDRRVIELLCSLPNEERAAGPPPKALLRRAMHGLLPENVRARESVAEFSPLVKCALVDAHGAALSRSLAQGRLVDAGLVDGPEVARVVERARRGDATVLREVVSLSTLETWLRKLAPQP